MADYRKRTWGTLYISDIKDPSITKPNGTNASTVIADFTALAKTEVWILNALAVEHLIENENTNYAMNCDISGAFLTTSDRRWNINSAVYSPNQDLLASLVDYYRESILGTPQTGVTYDFVVGTAYDVALPLPNSKEASYSITSLVENVTSYPLVENTDYKVSIVDGISYITFINSTNYDLTTNKVVVTYDYTPKAEEVMTGEAKQIETPYYAFIFESCEYDAKIDWVEGVYQDIYYFSKTRISGSVLDTYLNTGDTFEASDVTLQGDIGWVILKRTIKIS